MFNLYTKKMNSVKNRFSIKDLENLTGIKAHTIRIWEKRYAILEPMRTDTNIRYYGVESLQRLLNISTLHSFGYKISVISKFSHEKINELVADILSNKNMTGHTVNNFKLAMMNFDSRLFLDTYDSLLKKKPFRAIFYECFLPLLEEIGVLWQTGTITPAHEHFISNLIKQKIISNTEALPTVENNPEKRKYVLFLPLNEIHEIGLMFINYELLNNGHNTIYLGESVPVECLTDIKNYFCPITFITYLTTEPGISDVNQYIDSLAKQLMTDDTTKLYLLGKNTGHIDRSQLNNNISIFESIQELSGILNVL